jgi:hypothetical protein
MNNFFLEQVALLRQRIPQVDLDPLAKLRETLQDRECTFKFKPVKPDDVMKINLVSRIQSQVGLTTLTLGLSSW